NIAVTRTPSTASAKPPSCWTPSPGNREWPPTETPRPDRNPSAALIAAGFGGYFLQRSCRRGDRPRRVRSGPARACTCAAHRCERTCGLRHRLPAPFFASLPFLAAGGQHTPATRWYHDDFRPERARDGT